MLRRYQISTLIPYINWAYFFYAWKVKPDSDEGNKLKAEAVVLLNRFNRHYGANGVVQLYKCNSEDDDIILEHPTDCPCCRMNPQVIARLPMLRQQQPDSTGYCLCLSDFIRPKGLGLQDTIGLFATSVDSEMQRQFKEDDPYEKMLVQTLADRLAEAAAECLHEEVRKKIWGYAEEENLTMEELHQEKFVGIRPAIGYPCLPDISLNFLLDKLIDYSSIGVTLTGNGMMQPHSSVSGLMIRHPKARYFSVGAIDNVQLEDYALRRKLPVQEMSKYLEGNLM
ncbi:MAG: 5-methyltetrahydrofolate--homocysteine methyltransferase [Bacteroidaceae bacterium]|nr:5-methyltetrahydrofolate--homocysteine methyltransferase [Bacteroidaceae bacterium]